MKHVIQVEKDRVVTQTAKDRTVTGVVDLSPFTTFLTTVVTMTIASTAYLIPPAPMSGRLMMLIYNDAGENIYIGGSGVSTADGIPILDGKIIIVSASNGVYACCGTAGKTVRVLECK